jgi:two-component system sensor histidine kinase KdpD
MRPGSTETLRLGAALAGLAALTFLLRVVPGLSTASTVSMVYLMLVLLVAATSRLRVAVATSLAAVLALNYFFLPPVGTFTIADPHNWVALFTFLVVSLVATRLSATARVRAHEALSRRDELHRLFDLGRDILMITDSRGALAAIAHAIARRFDLALVAIAVPRDGDWDVQQAGSAPLAIDHRQLSAALAAAKTTLEFDAYAGTYAGHRSWETEGRTIALVPLRVGTRPIGVMASGGRPVEPGTLEALAGIAALGVERAHFLEQMKAAELTEQSERLKTALLASLSHDLRTPLTAIGVAASNLEAPGLADADRREQGELIRTEAARLTRLFENVLEMARIDAGAVSADARWAHPSEIIAAARDLASYALGGHPIEVEIDRDVPVQLDPRLTAAALSHLLENAGQYSPTGAVVTIEATLSGDDFQIRVRDRGPGIAAQDLPHLFDRFYRGAAARARTSGTGMGLWIVRGLLAAERGRVWAENAPEGGAVFTLAVPVAVLEPEPAGSPVP